MPRHVVGARELKVRLGTHLRRVREGRTLVITDRGEPVAELRPIGARGARDAILAKLDAEGAVTRPTGSLTTFRPIESSGKSLARAVVDARQDRF
jgi:prevent-host-death family protein